MRKAQINCKGKWWKCKTIFATLDSFAYFIFVNTLNPNVRIEMTIQT